MNVDPDQSIAPREFLRRWLNEQPAGGYLGEVVILPGFEVRHRADQERPATELAPVPDWTAWREMIKYDADGQFRPVRGFRGLRQGWRLAGLDFDQLWLALNWLYPAAIALWQDFVQGTLPTTEFAETASRQTGMYRLTQIITPSLLSDVVDQNCQRHCLRRRLWAPASPPSDPPHEIPLLCPEACNYLVGKARERVREGRC